MMSLYDTNRFFPRIEGEACTLDDKRFTPRPARVKKVAANKKGIHAVAALARVSMSTVSRVMNGASNVDARLKDKVWKAVAAVGYVPNRHAQALVSGRTRLLGLLVPEITNPFFPELIRGFEEAALAEGFGILVGSTNADVDRTKIWVQRMLQHGIEGLALLTFKREPDGIYDLLRGTPVVQVHVGTRIDGVDVVDVDYDAGIRQAVQHLAALGHRQIAFAAGSPSDFTAAVRLGCFRKAMREIGVTAPIEVILTEPHEHHTLEGGIEAAHRLIQRKTLPSALMCSNDLMAIGALRVFTSHKLRIPEDLSLVGLDDIHLAEFTSPPLSTVKIPRTDLAQACFDALFRRLKLNASAVRPDEPPATVQRVATSLTVRESTLYPPQATSNVRKTRTGEDIKQPKRSRNNVANR
jgi:DNA-binding LacI/PurR family transcriptional regulator